MIPSLSVLALSSKVVDDVDCVDAIDGAVITCPPPGCLARGCSALSELARFLVFDSFLRSLNFRWRCFTSLFFCCMLNRRSSIIAQLLLELPLEAHHHSLSCSQFPTLVADRLLSIVLFVPYCPLGAPVLHRFDELLFTFHSSILLPLRYQWCFGIWRMTIAWSVWPL